MNFHKMTNRKMMDRGMLPKWYIVQGIFLALLSLPFLLIRVPAFILLKKYKVEWMSKRWRLFLTYGVFIKNPPDFSYYKNNKKTLVLSNHSLGATDAASFVTLLDNANIVTVAPEALGLFISPVSKDWTIQPTRTGALRTQDVANLKSDIKLGKSLVFTPESVSKIVKYQNNLFDFHTQIINECIENKYNIMCIYIRYYGPFTAISDMLFFRKKNMNTRFNKLMYGLSIFLPFYMVTGGAKIVNGSIEDIKKYYMDNGFNFVNEKMTYDKLYGD